MQKRLYPDLTALSSAAAELLAEECERVLTTTSRHFTVALSGGRTPALMFDALARLPIDWERVHIFQVDERVAPRGSQDRNLTQLSEHLLERIEMPIENVHAMPAEHVETAEAAREYELTLARLCVDGALDFMQLGLGEDGHTASLAPGDSILEIDDRDVWHVRSFNGLPRISLTYPAIDRARRIVWLVSGPSKAEMCRRLLAGDRAIPAGRVRQDHAVLLADEQAASRS